MKLLFDHNLSPRLVKSLADIYPDSNHVYPLGLDQSHDKEIWEYARQEGFVRRFADGIQREFGALSIGIYSATHRVGAVSVRRAHTSNSRLARRLFDAPSYFRGAAGSN
ncbi:MAG: DUF5615 family PIN-like protein [Pyrinomonadaceae bacterium]|nr:DUF5615 family PIN-like protein [Pyrinomonadaceae bacterium]